MENGDEYGKICGEYVSYIERDYAPTSVIVSDGNNNGTTTKELFTQREGVPSQVSQLKYHIHRQKDDF